MASQNFGDALAEVDKGQEVPPAGEYDVDPVFAKVGKTSKGQDKIGVKFVVANGEYEGAEIWDNFNVLWDNRANMAVFFQNMALMGLGRQFFEQQPSLEQVAEAIKEHGGRVRLSMNHRQWQGRTLPDVKNYSEPLYPEPSQNGSGPVPSPQPTAASGSGDEPPAPPF